MKGPGLRIELDVRRLWECPACQRQDRYDGDVVSARCSCRDGGIVMRLVESRRQVRTFDVHSRQPDRSTSSDVAESAAGDEGAAVVVSGGASSDPPLAVDAIVPHPPLEESDGGESTPDAASPVAPGDSPPSA